MKRLPYCFCCCLGLRVRVGHRPVRAHVVEGARRLRQQLLHSIAQTPEGLSVARHRSRLASVRWHAGRLSWPRPTAQELPSKNIETRSLDRQIHLCIILPPEGFRSCTSAQTELRVQSGGSRSLWPRHFELARKQFPRAMHHVYSDAASQVPLSVHTRTYAPALGFNMYGPGEGRRVGIGLR